MEFSGNQVAVELTPGLLQMPAGLGENVRGTLLPLARLIRRLADRLDAAGIVWAVLRNAEDLPEFTRYDVDILVAPNQRNAFLQVLETCATETGWHISGRMRKRNYTCLLLVCGTVAEGLFFLPLDLFTALEFRGLRYLDAGTVLKERRQTSRGIWSVPAGREAAITLLKEWLPHGVLKDIARVTVQTQAAAAPDLFRASLEVAAGEELGGRLADAVRRGEWSLAAADWRGLRKAVRKRTPAWPLTLIDAGWQSLAHLFRPAPACVVCLAGADGSGKTTLARGLAWGLYKQPFKACRYIHGNFGVLPRFRDIRAWLRHLAGRPALPAAREPATLKGMMTPLPVWKSAALAAYYAVDLWLGRWRLRRWRGQWSLVLMDRSFYDYYYQLGHRRCPPWLLNLLAHLVPQPDLLLCIEDDPGRIHLRKPELTPEEIQKEQEILRNLAARLPFAFRLQGAAGVEVLVAAGQKKIQELLFGEDSGGAAPGTAGWCCWELAGRPWLAYAAGTRAQRRRAMNLFPCATFKRRIFQAGIRCFAALGVDTAFCARRKSAGDLLSRRELAGLLDEVARVEGAVPSDWLLAWPSRPGRQRLYLIFRGISGRTGVIKIGAGEFNGRQFRNEAETLQRLAADNHPFAVPAVLFGHELGGGRRVLALGGFPARFRSPAAAQTTHWSAEVIAHLGALKPAGLAHGDLGPGNMLLNDDGGLFLFDWENAAVGAPAHTDEVGFWLSLRQARVLRAPAAQREDLRRHFAGVADAELRAALDFLCARDNLAAARLLEAWP